jgi:hypothetical protein
MSQTAILWRKYFAACYRLPPAHPHIYPFINMAPHSALFYQPAHSIFLRGLLLGCIGYLGVSKSSQTT